MRTARNRSIALAVVVVVVGASSAIAACGSSNDAANGGVSDGGGAGSGGGSDATIAITTGSDGGSSGTNAGGDDDSATGEADGGVDSGAPVIIPARCNGSVASKFTAAGALPAPPALTVPAGFTIEVVATVGAARELAFLPNGDLLVATDNASVSIVPNADSDTTVGAATTFASFAGTETPAQGIAFSPTNCTIYVSTTSAIYALPYTDGEQSATPGSPIAHVRTGSVAPNSDGDVHTSTSVAVAGGMLYAGVGSSCNACTETDPTRATVQVMNLDGSNMTTRATRFRNAIALAENPLTHTLWAGGAGQDHILPLGHPYEFFDAVTVHPPVADYGWPGCEENHVAYIDGSVCTNTVAPLVELPAYSTIIGAVFYPLAPTGAHAWPSTYRGGLFLTAHGSWHVNADNSFFSPPRVAFVPMNGDTPQTAVDWDAATAQWTQVVGGFDTANEMTHLARPTGIAVGPMGSLFVADDFNGYVYRIRPR